MKLTRRTAIAALGTGLVLPAFPSARAAGAPVTIRVGFVPVIGASALFVADKAGWAAEQGLELKLSKFDSGPAAIQALASGTLDVLAIGVAPVAVAAGKGFPTTVVCGGATGGSSFVAAPPLSTHFAAARGNPAVALAAFRKDKGRPAKIATLPPGGVPSTALDYWFFKTNNVAREDIEIVTIGIEAIQQALLAGAADGGTMLEPSSTIALQRRPDLRAIVAAPEMFPNIPGVVYAAANKFKAEQPEALAGLVRVLVRGSDLVRTKPAEAAKYVVQVLSAGLVDEVTMALALVSPATRYVSDPRGLAEGTDAMLRYLIAKGEVGPVPLSDTLFDSAFYDRAIAGK